MDFTNRILIESGEDVAERSEEEAATVLARIVAENRFTLYEYFITDKVGHAQDMALARDDPDEPGAVYSRAANKA